MTRSRHLPLFASALAATLACAGPSTAADLGGDCCADLEERIADLEATAARKGNRKVSLRISGQVSQAILGFDDGNETNIYQVANSNSSDRFRFDGSARISKDLTAGYYVELGLGVASSAAVSQTTDDPGGPSVSVRQSIWYLDSKSLGAISLGLGAPATDDIIGYNLGGTSIAASADTSLVGTGLFTRDTAVNALNGQSTGNTLSLRWRRFLPQLDTPRANLVRYDSPTFKGFTASAAWGEDDFWDVAVRYAGRAGGFKFVAGVGYYENIEEDGFIGTGDSEVREFKGSASILHEATGLFLSGAYLHREFDGRNLGVSTFACFPSDDAAKIRALGIACTNRPDFDYYWVSGGVRLKALPLGTTVLYGEFARSEDAVTGLNVSVASAVGGDLDFVTSSRMDIWGVGIVQSIDAAAMDLFVSYRHFSADVVGRETSGATVVAPIDDAHLVMMGSRIRF